MSYRILMPLGIVMALTARSLGQGGCANGQCGQPYYQQPYYQSVQQQQPAQQQQLDYTDTFKTINSNFQKHQTKFDEIDKILNELKVKISVPVKQKDWSNEINLVQGNIRQLDENHTLLFAKVTKAVDELKAWEQTVTGVKELLNSRDKSFGEQVKNLETKFNQIAKEPGKLLAEINVIKAAAEKPSDLLWLKWLAGANLGIGGVALSVAVWAFKHKKEIRTVVKAVEPVVYHHYAPPQETFRHKPADPAAEYRQSAVETIYRDRPVAVEQPPVFVPPNPDVKYYPVETDSFRTAYKEACKHVVQKYPGMMDGLIHLDAMIDQFINAQPANKR